MKTNYQRRDDIRDPVRLGTRISADTNDWLDRRSQEIGLTKSAITNIALEQYRKDIETVTSMPKIAMLLEEYGLNK